MSFAAKQQEKQGTAVFVSQDDSTKIEVGSIEQSSAVYGDRWTRRLLKLGVEDRGVQPVPVELRTDTQLFKIFFIWFSWNINILTFSAGTLGPVVFGLGLRDSCLTILFFTLLCCIPPAYLCTWGPKTGMRQMIISRYTFGYYGVIIPCIFNLISMLGFSILNAILGGQALASVTTNLSWTVGIVVIGVISLLVAFCGYNVLSWYERIAWLPVVIIFIIALGLGGNHLSSPPPTEPASASSILSFASTLAGFSITFSGLSSDFTTYYRPESSSWRIFLYVYSALAVPIITLQCLGAAVVIAVPNVPEWQTGYEGGDVGGLFEAMLRPTGNSGKFLTVLLSLSVVGNMAATSYSASISLQVFIPWLVSIPRYVHSIIATVIVVALAIVGAHRFYDTLLNFLGLIGYWAGAFVAILIVEHLYFRRNNSDNYDITTWNVPHRLPSGLAALGAGFGSLALVVPSMHQVWYTGPIAKHTGDIGFEMAFALGGILYVPLRWLEIKIQKRL
ncbi:NCS cytosine-purine permease [Coprinopsis marcescibilis]|uniref:NCS cytosine-purine permease n=1 Tax=Coprinopsis marcescibilis TaxID=230819 RepID=A0A5C3L8U8_COPMA|nr:NCS cytosine-purine permease [Coprinopsis marcescibilis]